MWGLRFLTLLTLHVTVQNMIKWMRHTWSAVCVKPKHVLFLRTQHSKYCMSHSLNHILDSTCSVKILFTTFSKPPTSKYVHVSDPLSSFWLTPTWQRRLLGMLHVESLIKSAVLSAWRRRQTSIMWLTGHVTWWCHTGALTSSSDTYTLYTILNTAAESQWWTVDIEFVSIDYITWRWRWLTGWWFGLAVTRWSWSTKLLYARPG